MRGEENKPKNGGRRPFRSPTEHGHFVSSLFSTLVLIIKNHQISLLRTSFDMTKYAQSTPWDLHQASKTKYAKVVHQNS